jgi:hypothetical protein
MNQSIYKSSSLLVVICLIITGCEREAPGIKERPDNIISTKACPTLYSSIMEQFPEYRNNEASQALLFDAKAEKHVVLMKESEIYVSFISEGAGYTNTFGWYAYDSASAPNSSAALELHVLFPNVNNRILKQGDMLRLQDNKFKAGTVIGFFLIVGGWKDGAVDYTKPTLFTNYNLNPSGQQQHILFKQKDCGDVVLAFEDKLLGEASDADFNDIIFTVTDNAKDLEVSTLDLRTVIRM